MSVTNTILDFMPGEEYFTKSLQYPISFTLGKKIVKQGRLIIFKRTHYYIQITLLNSKNVRESFEIPIPFKAEYYPNEGLIFFDYRLISLVGNNSEAEQLVKDFKVKNTNPSQYYNKILEIKTNLL
jgi:hypothetical protein